MKPDKEIIIAIRLQELAQQLQCIVEELKVLINKPIKVKAPTAKELARARLEKRFDAMLIRQANKKYRQE